MDFIADKQKPKMGLVETWKEENRDRELEELR